MRIERDHLLYRMLVVTAPLARRPSIASVWERGWRHVGRRLDPDARLQMRLHGHDAIVNAGNPYPAFTRRWPSYNMPLVATVIEASRAAGRPIALADVGAAIGDTVLLVKQHCPGAVGSIHCVEGDPEFLEILTTNVSGFPEVEVHAAMVAEAEHDVPSLVRTHAGTASPQGNTTRRATTLDAVLAGRSPIDVVKVDTDGYDGRVLAGAGAVLDRDRPVVLFEWHPLLCGATGTPWRLPFDVLLAHDYDVAVWFTKFGRFDHVGHLGDDDLHARLARMCLAETGPAPDWHYDVVALPRGSVVSAEALAAASVAAEHGGQRG